MAGSISQQLEDLLNPLPKYADPEDDQDEETKAKIIEFDEDDDGEAVGVSALRKRNTSLLSETDGRYLGKPVSRKQLLEDIGESEDDDDVDDDDDDDDDDEEEAGDSEEDGMLESGDEVEDEDGEEDETEEEEQGVLLKDAAQVKTLVSKMKGANIIAEHPTEIDLHKLTDGMDDLGESEEDESDDDEGSEVDEMDDDDEEEDEDDEEEENQETMRTFSKEKVDGQVEKGKAVKDQLALWDQVLEGRIKLQRALVTANQLPQPETYPEFKKRGGAEFAGALKNSHKAIKALQRSLLELQDQLLFQNPETRPIALGKTWGAETRGGDDNEYISEEEEELEAGPPKRKLEMAEYPDVMAKRFAAFQPYRDATLQKWHDKTRLAGGGKGSKGFTAFDRSILTQVEQVLMDNERLVRRTQTRRSDYRVLGKREASAPAPTAPTTTIEDGGGEETAPLAKANAHLKDLDQDVFDDDDFYHQLLRELIERKTSAADPNDQVAMGRQWLAIQKLRSRIKKKVDTKASKGRKVRFNVHSKLVSFMAPVDHSPVNDEARTELYRCLFGNNPSSVRD